MNDAGPPEPLLRRPACAEGRLSAHRLQGHVSIHCLWGDPLPSLVYSHGYTAGARAQTPPQLGPPGMLVDVAVGHGDVEIVVVAVALGEVLGNRD